MTKISRIEHGLWQTSDLPPVTLVREPERFVYYAPGEQYDGLTFCFASDDDIEIEE